MNIPFTACQITLEEIVDLINSDAQTDTYLFVGLLCHSITEKSSKINETLVI